jgi:TRAP-type C4-dicarboxylate transport system permease small subunit
MVERMTKENKVSIKWVYLLLTILIVLSVFLLIASTRPTLDGDSTYTERQIGKVLEILVDIKGDLAVLKSRCGVS